MYNIQLDLFQKDREKQRILGYVMDGIRDKYGPKALLRGFPTRMLGQHCIAPI